jgi:hypothetical protein
LIQFQLSNLPIRKLDTASSKSIVNLNVRYFLNFMICFSTKSII